MATRRGSSGHPSLARGRDAAGRSGGSPAGAATHPGGAGRPRAPQPPPGGRRRGWFGRLFRIALVTLLIALIAVGSAVAVAVQNMPEFDALKVSSAGQTIRVRDANGTVFLALGPKHGDWLTLTETPRVMQDAMVAVEDRRFWSHPGVDPVGMARAAKVAFDNRGSGRRLQGASTITQQLARNIFLTNSYTLSRKAQEAVLAMAMEWKFSKAQILELYLNKVYFGGGSYGIDAASRTFFGHPATDLSLSEAAVIAGLVKAPSRFSPTADARAALSRSRVVLDVMVDAGVITASEAASARPAEVRLDTPQGQNSARYFTDWALEQLDGLIDNGTDTLDVWTTIDLSLQSVASDAIRRTVPRGAQGALVTLDRDGAVRAMVGGTDYVASNYNRATKAMRQPGSAWKLFVYLSALEAGFKVDDVATDSPVTIDSWSPRNSSGRFSGDMTLRNAFAYSINTIAAKLGNEVGFSNVASMARRFGITTPISTRPAMVLGSSETRVIDMTAAFAGVAARGRAVRPYGIVKVATAEGELLYRHEVEEGAALVDDWVAAGTIDMLQTAVNTGTGRAAQIGRPVAGKTGTTSANKDGWFLGFSSGLTTGVWMGRDDNKPVAGLQGGRAPATAFAAVMRRAVANRPIEPFDTQVRLPDWQLEDQGEAYVGAPGEGAYVDENGMPLELPPSYGEGGGRAADPGAPGGLVEVPYPPAPDAEAPVLNQEWLDRQVGRAVPPPADPPPPPDADPAAPRGDGPVTG